MTNFLEFRQVESGLTAKKHEVRAKRGGIPLGEIEYSLPRQTCVLAPRASTQWSKGCLQDVVKFIEGVESGRA